MPNSWILVSSSPSSHLNHWHTSDGPVHVLSLAGGPCGLCMISVLNGVVCYQLFSWWLWSQLLGDYGPTASQCGMETSPIRTAKPCRELCAYMSASQGLLSPLCRTSTSNAAKAELLKSSRTQITLVTLSSFYCHLTSASGAWWQKLRDSGGASSLRPSGS